ncbi:hypothetical protein KIPB_010933, partial [Kipferlia bialata]|eukprot:g10933.t1
MVRLAHPTVPSLKTLFTPDMVRWIISHTLHTSHRAAVAMPSLYVYVFISHTLHTSHRAAVAMPSHTLHTSHRAAVAMPSGLRTMGLQGYRHPVRASTLAVESELFASQTPPMSAEHLLIPAWVQGVDYVPDVLKQLLFTGAERKEQEGTDTITQAFADTVVELATSRFLAACAMTEGGRENNSDSLTATDNKGIPLDDYLTE